MKSKAHYKKCVELGIVPVPTTVCDENIDKDAIARLIAGGGNAEQSDSEEEDSDNEDSEESGSEEREEAAQSLLILSSRPATTENAISGVLRLPRPSTYPYLLSMGIAVTSAVSTTALSVFSGSSPAPTTIVQGDYTNRYYFPPNRGVQEMDKQDEQQTGESKTQPMDLTTKQVPTPRPKPADILTPVSEPVLLQTLVQTMERLPIQSSREWKPEAEDGHMLQAYLTERHVMDSKIKQQYRV